jgi:glycerol-3-phosphate cytidylyltransferase-like family protein
MPEVFVSGAFNDLRSRDVRLLQEAARLGKLTVVLRDDETFQKLMERVPEFPQAERLYMLEAIRYVNRVV